MKHNLIAGACALITLSLPLVSDAYFTSGQHAFSVDDTVGVYTIDFSFGQKNREVSIPIIANNTDTHSGDALSYSVRDDEIERAKGTAVGIVLSDAPVKNGMYVVPKGVAKKFTLLVLFTPSADETESKFNVQVNYLPFAFDGIQQLHLNPSELQYYKTPPLTLVR